MEEESKGKFSGKIGYVLATAGSAVGLGNIWRFPYMAAKYGGGMFLLVYVLLVITLGFTMVLTETTLGRKTGKSAIDAFGSLAPKAGWIGWIHAVVPCLILPYYSVIGGWVLKYFFSYLTGGGKALASDSAFTAFISSPGEPVLFFAVFIVLTALIVVKGVENGIEKASKVMMPLLVILTVIVAIFSMTRPGAGAGVKYYLVPNFSNFSFQSLLGAMGQMFYSLSISMGILVTYGSYMKKDVPLSSSVKQVIFFDTAIAFLAGLMVIPAVFAFSGGNPEALKKGPSLLFITLPKVFDSMKGIGTFMGALFFLLVFFAAITSSISLFEAVVSILRDKTGFTRKKASVIVLLWSLVIGTLTSLGFGPLASVHLLGFDLLDFFDFITNSVLMPIAAFCTCIFVSKVVGVQAIDKEVECSSPFREKKLYNGFITFLAPFFIIAILVSSVMEGLGFLAF